MKIVGTYWVLGSKSCQMDNILSEIENSIITTPLTINPTKKGNGVRPIKAGVVSKLLGLQWSTEYCMDLKDMRSKPLDGYKSNASIRAGFEWETGNISSSFRALMKLIKGLVEDQIDLGIHVLPSRDLYNFLTDRIGNIRELTPYLDIFGRIQIGENKALVIYVIEHDAVDKKVRLIPKGNDGMSFTRRRKA